MSCLLTSSPQPFLQPFFRDHPGEPVPEENFWTLWCKGRLTEGDTPTIRLGTTPSGLTSAHLIHPHFLQAGCPSCRQTSSVKALKATTYFFGAQLCGTSVNSTQLRLVLRNVFPIPASVVTIVSK